MKHAGLFAGLFPPSRLKLKNRLPFGAGFATRSLMTLPGYSPDEATNLGHQFNASIGNELVKVPVKKRLVIGIIQFDAGKSQ